MKPTKLPALLLSLLLTAAPAPAENLKEVKSNPKMASAPKAQGAI